MDDGYTVSLGEVCNAKRFVMPEQEEDQSLSLTSFMFDSRGL
jgi:hypothetical protein